jgi:Flp pilus assembly pilin Flp
MRRPGILNMISKSILAKFRDCIKSNGGVTAIEYGLIAAATGFATALGMAVLGPTVAGLYRLVVDAF